MRVDAPDVGVHPNHGGDARLVAHTVQNIASLDTCSCRAVVVTIGIGLQYITKTGFICHWSMTHLFEVLNVYNTDWKRLTLAWVEF